MGSQVFVCEMCFHRYTDRNDVFYLFSDEIKEKDKKAPGKIMSTMGIVVIKDHPKENLLCEICYAQIDTFYRYMTKCKALRKFYLDNPSNYEYIRKIDKFMSIPIKNIYSSNRGNVQKKYEKIIQFLEIDDDRNQTLQNGHTLDQSIQPNSNHNSVHNNIVTNIHPIVDFCQASISKFSDLLQIQEPKIAINGVNSEQNIVGNQNLQSSNIPPKNNQNLKTVNTDHNYNMPSTVNGSHNNDEVITLDESGDENDVPHSNNNIDNTKKSKKSIAVKKRRPNISNVLTFNRMLLPRNGFPSTSSTVLSEEMTVTPDISLPNTDTAVLTDTLFCNNNILIHQPICNIVEPNERAFVTPETGFHFLFTSDQTVDLTNADTPEKKKEEPSKCKRKKNIADNDGQPTKKNKKILNDTSKTKKGIPPSATITSASPSASAATASASTSTATASASTSTATASTLTSIQNLSNASTKSRPKRASTITSYANSAVERNKNSALLGKQALGNWNVHLSKLNLLLYQCSICNKCFHSSAFRIKHEKNHKLPPWIDNSQIDLVSTLENATSTEQQEFLIYFNLVKRTPIQKNANDILASRPNLHKALQKIGDKIGNYKCKFCEYKTCRLYVLWVHTSTQHSIVVPEKKSGSYCFTCNRFLFKRSKLLKHLDKCADTEEENETTDSENETMDNEDETSQSVENLSCDLCNAEFHSLSHFEKHLWNHPPT